jgi:hypothetical protein
LSISDYKKKQQQEIECIQSLTSGNHLWIENSCGIGEMWADDSLQHIEGLAAGSEKHFI